MIGPFTLDDITLVMCYWMNTRMTLGALRNFRKFYPNVKILVVDNGSKDNDTGSFGSAYSSVSPNLLYDNDIKKLEDASEELKFKIINLEKNMGHGGGTDYGLDAINTKLMLTMDSDIRLLPKAEGLLEKYLADMNQDPEHIFAVGTEWMGNEYFDRWVGLWFSIFQKEPIKRWHLTFSNIVLPVWERLNIPFNAFHCETGLMVYKFLTYAYPPNLNPYRAVFYPNPGRLNQDVLCHIKIRTTGDTDEKIKHYWDLYLDG